MPSHPLSTSLREPEMLSHPWLVGKTEVQAQEALDLEVEDLVLRFGVKLFQT